MSSTRRRGRPRSPVREALTDAIAGGLVGSLELLAAHTGWPPAQVRSAIYEMARAGHAQLRDREHTGKRGQRRGVYGAPIAAGGIDSLEFARQVWR